MRSLGLALFAVAAMGCGGAPADTIEVAQPIEVPAGSLLRTVVHLAATGLPTVKYQLVTEEQAHAAATRRAGGVRPEVGVVEDDGCNYADLELYDETYFNGNEICFFGAAGPNSSASLSDYQHAGQHCIVLRGKTYCPTWSQRVRSFGAGTQSVYFFGPDGDEYYPAEALQFTADTAVAAAVSFILDYQPL